MKSFGNILRLGLSKKIFTIALVSISAASFATLGHKGGKKLKEVNTSIAPIFNARNFSLRSGYNYKSNLLLSKPENRNFIMLNTVITYKRGNNVYVMPLKRKLLLDKIRINPLPDRF